MKEFKDIVDKVMEQYWDGAITEREAYAKIVSEAATRYQAAPKVEGIDV